MGKGARFEIASIVILVLGIVFFASAFASGAEKKNLSFALDWIFHGGHTPYFVALEKGFYKDRGLGVNIGRGFGAADGPKRLSGRTNDLVFNDTGAMILARAAGAKVRMLAVMYEKAPHVIYTLKKSGISKPKDLEGKTVATSPGDAI